MAPFKSSKVKGEEVIESNGVNGNGVMQTWHKLGITGIVLSMFGYGAKAILDLYVETVRRTNATAEVQAGILKDNVTILKGQGDVLGELKTDTRRTYEEVHSLGETLRQANHK
jgi:hypothetical protein